MVFDEWWATKDLEQAQAPGILKAALKELAYEAWCESRHHQINKLPECPNCGETGPVLACEQCGTTWNVT